MGRMMTAVFALLFVVSIQFLPAQTTPAGNTLNWKAISEVWNAYVADPSAENANKLFLLVPLTQVPKELFADVEATTAIEKIIAEISVLESQLLFENNRVAVKIAFHFYNFQYPDMRNKINKMLGNLIHFNVRMFLEELNENRALVTDLEGILSSYKFDIVDDQLQMEITKKIRLNALKGIDDKNLNTVKNECLKIMKKL
jgi:hypothetical protein